MDETTKTYNIDRKLEAALAAAAMTGEPVRLGNTTYRLSRVDEGPNSAHADDIWAGYDPTKVDEALDRHAGSWSDLDPEEMKKNLYRAREEGSRPLSRP